MQEKKTKQINIRISLDRYKYLKKRYLWIKEFNREKHKSFSDYIRYLLDLGLEDYY